jgi:hypothetical protein
VTAYRWKGLAKEYAEGVEVRTAVHDPALRQFGRHVRERSTPLFLVRNRVPIDGVAEVDEPSMETIADSPDDDVLQGQIGMEPAGPMHMDEALADRLGESRNLGSRNPPCRLGEGLPPDMLQDQRQPAVVLADQVEQPGADPRGERQDALGLVLCGIRVTRLEHDLSIRYGVPGG